MDRQVLTVTLCCLLLSTGVLQATEPCGGVAEEGADYTVTCRFAGSSPGLLWQLQVGNNYVEVSNCSAPGACTNTMPISFVASLAKGTDHDGASFYTGQLRIIRVNRTKNTFRCVALDQSQSLTCNVHVYVRTQKPTCQGPSLTLVGTETHLQVTCISERVYPDGDCNFTSKGLPTNIYTQVSVNNSQSTASPGNYRTQCTWLARLTGVNPAYVEVRAEVYPSLPKWVEAASTYSEWTQKVLLAYPIVKLASSCPSGPSARDGYILQGTVATCRCDLASQGFPPGSAQWFTQDGHKLGVREDNGSAILTLGDSVAGSSFVCRPVSALNQSASQTQDVHFSPQYAVGPTALIIDLSDSFPLCPSESLTYRITCKVHADNVVPAPLFTISINNKMVSSSERGQLDPSSRYHQLSHTFRPDAGGSLNIYCKAANSIFTERFYDSERPFIIYEPPKQAPKLKTPNNQPHEGSQAFVSDRTNVFLTCVVEGGYPGVTNVTITCGGHLNTMPGTSAVIHVGIPENVQTLLCICSASHVTGCYHQRSEVVLTLEQPRNSHGNSSDSPNSSLSLGLGIGLGGAVFVIIILIIFFIIVHKRKERISKDVRSQRSDYNHPNYNSDAFYHYASVVQGTPVPPPSLQPDLLAQNDYDLIALDTDHAPDTTVGKYLPSWNESSTDPGQDTTVQKQFPQESSTDSESDTTVRKQFPHESLTDQVNSDLAYGYIQPI